VPSLHEADLAIGALHRPKHAVDAVAGVSEDVPHAPLMYALDDEI
jgi:hypothetical protein